MGRCATAAATATRTCTRPSVTALARTPTGASFPTLLSAKMALAAIQSSGSASNRSRSGTSAGVNSAYIASVGSMALSLARNSSTVMEAFQSGQGTVRTLFSMSVNSAAERFGGRLVQPTLGNIKLSLCPAPQLGFSQTCRRVKTCPISCAVNQSALIWVITHPGRPAGCCEQPTVLRVALALPRRGRADRGAHRAHQSAPERPARILPSGSGGL
jgi:hypothetical protein